MRQVRHQDARTSSRLVRIGPAPTLLIVGGDDTVVLDLNRDALAKLNCEKSLPGATHLLEEPGALDQVAGAASDWFAFRLRPKQ